MSVKMSGRKGKTKILRPILRKDAFFGFHTDLHPHEKDTNLGGDVNEEMVERFLKAVKPDYIQYDCKGHFGYAGYPTRVGWPSPGIKKNSLKIWRRVTKKHGIALIIHYSGVWDAAAVKHHPDWAAVNADGKPDHFATSTFGPYVNELMIPQLKEVIKKYDLDGVWVDADCWGVKLDYGEKALQKFKRKTGFENAPRREGDPHWNEFLEFHREQFRKYLITWVNALHEFKPGFQVTSNIAFSPLMPEPVSAPLDFLSGDYVPAAATDWARLTARYFSATGMPWDLMAWGFNKGENQKNWSLKTPVQLEQEASVTLAQGGGWQFVEQGTRSGFIDASIISLASDVAKYCRERQALCHKTQSVPQIALLLPTISLYDKLREDRALFGLPMQGPIIGLLHALLELHYSVDVKAEHHLRGHLRDYPVVAVPDCHLLSDDFIGELKEYVRKGGNLLLAGPQAARIFKEDVGVLFDGDLVDMAQIYQDLENRSANKELIFLDPDFPELYIETDGSLGDCAGLYQRVKPITAEPVNYCYPTKDTRRNGMCASSVVKYGTGTIGAIYVSLATSFYESHAPVVRGAFKKIMKKVFPKPIVELDAPNCIDVSIRKKGGKLLINFVNTFGMHFSPKYAVTNYIPPVTNLKITVRLETKPLSVFWAYGGKNKLMRYKNGKLHVLLDELKIHDALVIKLCIKKK